MLDISSNNIFILGKAGSGKDTLAELLYETYLYKRFAFADNVRTEFTRFFPNENPRLHRNKLIDIGQVYKKLYGLDVWAQMMYRQITDYQQFYMHPLVTTDGRYQVEFDLFVTQLGYTPVRVYCDDDIRYERLQKRDGTLQKEALLKESTELDNVEAYTIDNSRDFSYTARQLKTLIQMMGR